MTSPYMTWLCFSDSIFNPLYPSNCPSHTSLLQRPKHARRPGTTGLFHWLSPLPKALKLSSLTYASLLISHLFSASWSTILFKIRNHPLQHSFSSTIFFFFGIYSFLICCILHVFAMPVVECSFPSPGTEVLLGQR